MNGRENLTEVMFIYIRLRFGTRCKMAFFHYCSSSSLQKEISDSDEEGYENSEQLSMSRVFDKNFILKI